MYTHGFFDNLQYTVKFRGNPEDMKEMWEVMFWRTLYVCIFTDLCSMENRHFKRPSYELWICWSLKMMGMDLEWYLWMSHVHCTCAVCYRIRTMAIKFMEIIILAQTKKEPVCFIVYLPLYIHIFICIRRENVFMCVHNPDTCYCYY